MTPTNPYCFERPIAAEEAFYNRVSETHLITARIATEQPQSVSVVGGPKSGKTSLLNYLNAEAIRQQYLPDPGAYIPLQLALGQLPPDDPSAFFTQLSAALEGAGHDPFEPNTDGFDRAVKKLMKNGKKLVLFLDDFGTVTQNGRFGLDFFSFMRSVANGSDVGYVTTSSAPLQELCHTADIEDSPFFNIFTTVNLEPFSDEAARQLVEEPAATVGRPMDKTTDWVLQLAGRSPHLLQLTAHTAFAYPDADRKRLADLTFEAAAPFLNDLWSEVLSAVEKEVLTAVRDGKPIGPQLAYVAEDLKDKGYLQQTESGYGLGFELLERCLAKRVNFWKRIFG